MPVWLTTADLQCHGDEKSLLACKGSKYAKELQQPNGYEQKPSAAGEGWSPFDLVVRCFKKRESRGRFSCGHDLGHCVKQVCRRTARSYCEHSKNDKPGP